MVSDGREVGYVYKHGFPTALSAELLAEEIELPRFEGEAPRPLRVSPQVRLMYQGNLPKLKWLSPQVRRAALPYK